MLSAATIISSKFQQFSSKFGQIPLFIPLTKVILLTKKRLCIKQNTLPDLIIFWSEIFFLSYLTIPNSEFNKVNVF